MAQKYLALSHPSMKDSVTRHNHSILRLAVMVSEFSQEMAAAHELFSKEMQTVVDTYKQRSYELKQHRPVDTPCTIFTAWDKLLSETEMDAQAHVDAAALLMKNVYQPLQEVATHKGSHTQRLSAFRELLENLLARDTTSIRQVKEEYEASFQTLVSDPECREAQSVRDRVLDRHNEYVLQLRAANRAIEQFRRTLPDILEELEEIYIDTSNTVNVAIEGHALLLLTKATEQRRRFEDQLKICRQVNPQLDLAFFVKAISNHDNLPTLQLPLHRFTAVNTESPQLQMVLRNQVITNERTEQALNERRVSLQRRGMELASVIKICQDRINSRVNICQRNMVKHQYAKVYEAQEDMCRKRNEIRIANMQLVAIKAQMEMLTQKQNGSPGGGPEGSPGGGGTEEQEQEDKKEHRATIKGLWKKAFKSLKSSGSSSGEHKLSTKKGASLKRKDSKEVEEPEPEEPKEIDPVYSLLKCAADLPRVSRASKEGQLTPQSAGGGGGVGGTPCTGGLVARHGDSSGSTSKASSPSSSASHSPKTRRKKLNARMKSFSLDTPDPPKQLLAIDETTKKKSNSFTNTCFGAAGITAGGGGSSGAPAKKRFGWSHRSSSLEIEDRKLRHRSLSPNGSPKIKKKDLEVYIVLYHFRGKEKDDMDLRAGSRIAVTNSSDPDWWKGKYNGRTGYFPAKYVLRIEDGQQIFQVLRTINLTEMDGLSGIRLHKDQIVFQVNPEFGGFMHVRSASNRNLGNCRGDVKIFEVFNLWLRRVRGVQLTYGLYINAYRC
ncbi:uncharacterized protein LOC143286309 [Babylonia areolata]|uniref:uncharacterized protein LOC143286309 n=1 Tax=Babylonia areolata TaxID=304850 RepID=UPI003FD13A77